MAIVKTRQIGTPDGLVKMQIKCNTKGRFYAELPRRVADTLPKGAAVVRGETLDQVEREFKRLLSEHSTANTTETRVILYELSLPAQESDDDFYSCDSSLHVSLSCVNAVRKVTKNSDGEVTREVFSLHDPDPEGLEGERVEVYPGAEDGSWRHCTDFVEWTPSREEFFQAIVAGMSALISRLRAFKEPAKLAELADAGRLPIEMSSAGDS